MAETSKTKTENAPDKSPTMSADDFGVLQSSRDGRVELVNAFVAGEKRAGRKQDTEDAYVKRLSSFARRPA